MERSPKVEDHQLRCRGAGVKTPGFDGTAVDYRARRPRTGQERTWGRGTGVPLLQALPDKRGWGWGARRVSRGLWLLGGGTMTGWGLGVSASFACWGSLGRVVVALAAQCGKTLSRSNEPP